MRCKEDLGRRPVRKEEEARLQEVLADTHDSFKGAVKAARGSRLAAPDDPELWSGRVWTGRQAARLGLTDGVAQLEAKMREKVGDNVRRPLLSNNLHPKHWMCPAAA